MMPTEPRPLVTSDRRPNLQVERVAEARNDPPLRGESLWSALERGFGWLTQRAGTGLPEAANPLARAGAVANTSFVIALVTGILLLFWYRPSVLQAYGSLENMDMLGQLMRSLHRYSSDVAMLFALFHGLQTIAGRKVGGARWLAFLSGLIVVGLLWLDGWTGYWLVWDERGRQVALATAALVDLLPIFPDPLSRSFLTDGSVNSLLFFIVFFIHMLVPVAMALLLWAHILRVNRSRLFTGRILTIWLMGCLVAVSLIAPALSAEPAQMSSVPAGLTGDWWYLGPLTVIERLGEGAIWGVFGIATLVLFVAPWVAPKRRVKPTVIDADRCNGCQQCFQDCPFNAIKLLETDPEGRESGFFAQVDPARCVGCGTCVGSCDSSAIDAPLLPVLDARRFLNTAAKAEYRDGATMIAFVCGASAGGALKVNSDGLCDDLPGYRVIPVMCTGWVHMLTIERALRHGAAGVLIVGCGHDAPCRESGDWTAERLSGERGPSLRQDRVDPERVKQLRLGAGGFSSLRSQAADFRTRCTGGEVTPQRKTRQGLISGSVVAVVIAVAVWGPSDLPLLLPEMDGSQLVVTFKHAGQPLSSIAAAEDPNVLPHMRRARPTGRGRNPVRMRVFVDGALLSEEEYQPSGLFGDGASIAVAEFPVPPGEHVVSIQLADGSGDNWPYQFQERITFNTSERRVIDFDATSGFRAH